MTPDPERDERLSHLLHNWQVDRPNDPQLAHKVWQRIEAGGGADATTTPWWARWGAALARPSLAGVSILAFALLGGLAAELQSSARRDARLTRLAVEYAQSIDPVLMTSAGHAAATH